MRVYQSDGGRTDAGPSVTLPAFIRRWLSGDRGCALGLCLLPLLAYLPALVHKLTANPLYFVAALSTGHRRGVIAGSPFIDPNAGYTVQALGKLSADIWLSGHIPWWNPYMGVGVPLAAEMQPSSFFLPFVLLLHFQSGIFWLKLILQILSALATYALLRQLSLSRCAAFAGAAIYEFNGTFAWFSDMPILPLPFLPFLLLGIEKAAAGSGERCRYATALIGFAIAYSLLAGFPETAFLNGLLALCWAIYRLFTLPRSTKLAFALRVATGGASGVLCSLPLLVPFFEYLQVGQTAHGGLGGVGLDKISLAGLLFPYIFGPLGAFTDMAGSPLLGNHWGSVGGYLDIVALALACVALFTSPSRSRLGLRILLFLWIVLFVAHTMTVPGIGATLKLVPGMDSIAVFRYSEPSWAMAAAVLVALAIDDRIKTPRRPFSVILIPCLLVVGLGIYSLRLASPLISALLQHREYDLWFRSSFLWPLAFLGAIAFLFIRPPTRSHSRWLAGLVTANAMGLFLIPQLSGFRNNSIDWGLVNFLRVHSGLNRVYTLGPLAPNYGSYFKIASVNYNALPIPAPWVQYIHSSMDAAAHSILFTGFIPQPMADRQRELRTHIAGFENAGVRYVLAEPNVNPFTGESSREKAVEAPWLAYQGAVASVWELPHPAPYFEAGGTPCRLQTKSRELVQANCSGPTILIRRELAYPGWQASVNSAPFAPVASKGIFQSVALPAGASSVEFRYIPTGSAWTSAAALTGFVALAASLVRRRSSHI